MKKILHLIQTSGPGGAEKVALAIARNSRRRYPPVFGLLRNGWLAEQLRSEGIKVEIIPSGNSFDLKLVRGIIRLIRRENVGLVHSHLLDMNFYSSVAASVTRTPHIATEHGDIHHTSKRLDAKTLVKAKIISRLADRIAFVSRFTREIFVRICKMPEEKSPVVYNGINLEECEPAVDLREKKAEAGVGEDDAVVGNIANLYPVKGQIHLLKAARMVVRDVPGAKFLIVGRGELECALREEARRLGIASRVRFLGFRDDIRELLKIMDVFALSSLSEGLPVSLIEAMSGKVPVVATGTGGIPEVIDDGMNGFLVPPADPRAMAGRIVRLLKDKALSRKFAELGYERMKRQFCLRSMIGKYEEMYSSLIGWKEGS